MRRPFGFTAQDVRHGMLCSVVAAAAGGELSPDKFMLGKHEEPEIDVYEQVRRLMPDPLKTLQVKTGPEGGINFEQPMPGPVRSTR